MAVHRHPTDSRQRPYIQIRLYGQMAIDVDRRADEAGISRSTYIAEVIHQAWAQPSTASPIEPTHTFTRQSPRTSDDTPPADHETPSDGGTRVRARVFAPQGRR